MLDLDILKKYENKTPPWGPLGYITYKRTYSRDLGDRTEEWHETIFRCVNGIIDLGCDLTKEEAELLFDYVFNFKCNFGGRHLWQLGTQTINKVGVDSLQNCWHVAVDTPDAFTFTFNQLMLGGGVGFNISPTYIYSLPPVKRLNKAIQCMNGYDVDYIVTDNREGWVDLLRRVLDAYYFTGRGFTYSVDCVRGRGKAIKNFGGVASGPDILVQGIGEICGIFERKADNKLDSIDCLDIMNIIGTIVVSGNVRRSAQIALGNANDIPYLRAKRWDQNNIPNWRVISNNSVVCNDIHDLPPAFWDTYEVGGEPYGLVNLNNCKSYGRMSDEFMYRPDIGVVGVNPCGEITLESFESCNLSELYLPNLKNIDEFQTAAKLMYKVCKTISCNNFSDPRTQAVVNRNHRIGIGVTGYYGSQWMDDAGAFELVYRSLEKFDKEYSKAHGVCISNKLTTVKPAGTSSLLPDKITPGAHPAYAPYYIRRVRFAANHPLVPHLIANGNKVEPQINLDGSYDANTVCVDFAVDNSNCITAKEISPIEQLETQAFLQDSWADNSVSTTIYYKKSDLPNIKEWLENNYKDRVKCVSFLLHQEHGFIQAPYEEITEEEYNRIKRPTINKIETKYFTEELESCEGGACPVR